MLSAILSLLSKIFLFTGKLTNKNTFAKPLSSKEEKECFEKMKQGNKEAEEKLIKHNLRLVAHVVKKYNNTNIDQDELISVGSIGLLKSIKTYDTLKGHTFSTYAARCIQNEILMLIRSNKKYQNEISIEEKIGTDKDGNEISFIDILQDNKESVEDIAQNKIIYKKLLSIINKTLSQREKDVIYMRYGIGGGYPLTQSETAKVLGISRSYISRIEKKAIEEIKKEFHK